MCGLLANHLIFTQLIHLIVRSLWESTGIVPLLCTTRQDIDEIVAIVAESAKETMESVEARRAAKKAKAG